MQTGFTWATRAGISFGKDDMVIPAAKTRLVDAAQARVKEFEQQYQEGLITQGEKYNKVIDAWSETTDKVADEMMKEIQADKPGERSEEHTSELQSLMRISYAVFCLKKTTHQHKYK